MNRIDEIAGEISRIMPKIARVITANFSQMCHMPPAQIFTILTIHEKGSASFSDLKHAMNVSAPTVTGIIDRLEKSGFTKRIHSKEDRRVVNVVLTKKGAALTDEIRHVVKNNWKNILSRLPTDDCENYLRIIKKIQEQIKQ